LHNFFPPFPHVVLFTFKEGVTVMLIGKELATEFHSAIEEASIGLYRPIDL
jgi:hypothetical protein